MPGVKRTICAVTAAFVGLSVPAWLHAGTERAADCAREGADLAAPEAVCIGSPSTVRSVHEISYFRTKDSGVCIYRAFVTDETTDLALPRCFEPFKSTYTFRMRDPFGDCPLELPGWLGCYEPPLPDHCCFKDPRGQIVCY